MDDLQKRLENLRDLLKAINGGLKTKLNPQVMPKLPEIPSHKNPPQPSMSPKASAAPKISSGQGPDSKKDPRKIAQQIKDGSMSNKSVKAMLKADSVTGQWYLEPTTPASV